MIVFTEESVLGDQDLRATGWNTYHAGFRYVHELSGQGLRPVYGTDKSGRHSWKICASLGGYAVLSKYSARHPNDLSLSMQRRLQSSDFHDVLLRAFRYGKTNRMLPGQLGLCLFVAQTCEHIILGQEA